MDILLFSHYERIVECQNAFYRDFIFYRSSHSDRKMIKYTIKIECMVQAELSYCVT